MIPLRYVFQDQFNPKFTLTNQKHCTFTKYIECPCNVTDTTLEIYNQCVDYMHDVEWHQMLTRYITEVALYCSIMIT